MDAISYLKSQHREVEELFAQIENAENSKQKKTLFAEVARKLEHHAKIEEKFFYPEGEDVDEDATLEAYEEHEVMRGLIRKIKKTSPGDETFMAKVTVLKEIVEHHVEEEEEEYFPECQKEFGREKLEELGEQLEAAFEKLEGSEMPRKQIKRAA